MSIFKEKERTYPFTLEGLALCKADANWHNKLNGDYNSLLFLSALGISIIGLCLLISPMATSIAYKTIELESAKVAYKVIEGVL